MIPTYFLVKRDDTPEWKKYIEWLNNTYKVNWGGIYKYYGYTGNNIEDLNGTHGDDSVLKDIPLFTAQEFMKLINESMKINIHSNDVIHCPTEQEGREIYELFNMNPKSNFYFDAAWHNCDKQLCINPTTGGFNTIDYYQQLHKKIIPASVFLSIYPNKTMKKKILKREDFKRIIALVPPNCPWYSTLLTAFRAFTHVDEMEVNESIYAKGRKEATKDMNVLLDEIFGVDEPKVNYQDIFRSVVVYPNDYISLPTGFKYKLNGTHLIATPI